MYQVARPRGLAVADGKVFVADGAGGRGCIAVFDATTLLPAGAEGGGGFASLASPCGLTAHGFELIVCDRGAHRLRVFSLSGESSLGLGSMG